MGETSIEWTDVTWNPVRGCSRISEGCRNCYAEAFAARFSDSTDGLSVRDQPFHGFAERTPSGPRWTGKVELIPEMLAKPLSWRKPRRCFVNSMSDLFHESLSNEQIAAVFGVMAATPHITYQILTKRAARLPEWFEWVLRREEQGRALFPDDEPEWRIHQMLNVSARRAGANMPPHHGGPWPLPNVWLGVSVENQQAAFERIPHLLSAPAAIRFLSVEPQLGAVDLKPYVTKVGGFMCPTCGYRTNRSGESCPNDGAELVDDRTIDWVIVGGESGHGARPLDLAWVRSIVRQCREAGVSVFVKQLGPHPFETVESFAQLGTAGALEQLATLHEQPVPKGWTAVHDTDGTSRLYRYLRLKDKKGGEMSEWPEDLQVREMPEVAHA